MVSTKGIKMIERHGQECPGIRPQPTQTVSVDTQTDTVEPPQPDTTEIDTLKRNLELEKTKK